MSNLFENCENLTYIDFSKLKTEKIKSMDSAFLNCVIFVLIFNKTSSF